MPKRVDEIAVEWSLSALIPMENLSYNYVLSGFQGTQPIILKLCINVEDLNAEAVALKSFEGFGAVKVLMHEEGAILLERAVPGDLLKSFFPNRDHEAIQIVCGLMKKLHQAPLASGHTFPHVRDWLSALDKKWDIPDAYLEKARLMKDQLLKTSPNEVLLHGDLHHENILRYGEQFVIIDPKGVI
ncbi:MAG: aminoglycoside phosphotransferase family protein, partial [Nitrososphaerales archaeon]